MLIAGLTVKFWCSILSFSTPEPYSSRSRHIIRVFLPAPVGPYTSKWAKSPLCTCGLHKAQTAMHAGCNRFVAHRKTQLLVGVTDHSFQLLSLFLVIVQFCQRGRPIFIHPQTHLRCPMVNRQGRPSTRSTHHQAHPRQSCTSFFRGNTRTPRK